MTYTKNGDKVTLEMTADDYNALLIMLGYAAGSAEKDGEHGRRREMQRFFNEMNRTNPNFTPYEVPPKEPTGGGSTWNH